MKPFESQLGEAANWDFSQNCVTYKDNLIDKKTNVSYPTSKNRKNMARNGINKLSVQGTDINIIRVGEEDYICLTDMMKAKDGDFFVTDWLRNRNTLEYIGIWEKVYNPNFNYGEFATMKKNSRLTMPVAELRGDVAPLQNQFAELRQCFAGMRSENAKVKQV